MKLSFKTYTVYSISCAVVWAIIFGVVRFEASKDTEHNFTVLFFGWTIGWLSATIARSVYPPPKRWRPSERAS